MGVAYTGIIAESPTSSSDEDFTFKITAVQSEAPNIVNLVYRSQQFDNISWTKGGSGTGIAPVVTPNFDTAPDGSTTASQIVFNKGAGNASSDYSTLYPTNSTVPSTIGVVYTSSFWVKGTPGDTFIVRGMGWGVYTLVTVTGSWQRFVWSEPAVFAASMPISFSLRAGEGYTLPSTVTILLWGVQTERNTVVSGYDVTTDTAGVDSAPPDNIDSANKIIAAQSESIVTSDSQTSLRNVGAAQSESPAYPFHLRFTPAAGEALVDASSSLDAYVNKVADWNLFGPGSLVFVDLGTCGTACQNAL